MFKKKLSILLVDDDEIERMKFKKVCKINGIKHKLTEATNGLLALKKIEKSDTSFDIVFLDLHMPKMNGIEFLKAIRGKQQFKNLPIVVLTTSESDEELKKCIKSGVSGFFYKPQVFEEYKNKISSVLNYWQNNKILVL